MVASTTTPQKRRELLFCKYNFNEINLNNRKVYSDMDHISKKRDGLKHTVAMVFAY